MKNENLVNAFSHLAPLCLFINLIFLICFFDWFEPKPDLFGSLFSLASDTVDRGLGVQASQAEDGPTLLAQAFNLFRWVFVYAVGLTGVFFSANALRQKFGAFHIFWIVCNGLLLAWTVLMAVGRLT